VGRVNLPAESGSTFRWNQQQEDVPNIFRYIGGVWDSQAGLYKLGERYYDPGAGRFTQVDPKVACTGTAYAYAHDDPVNSTDPSGMDDFQWCDFIIGVMAGTFAGAGCAIACSPAGPVGIVICSAVCGGAGTAGGFVAAWWFCRAGPQGPHGTDDNSGISLVDAGGAGVGGGWRNLMG